MKTPFTTALKRDIMLPERKVFDMAEEINHAKIRIEDDFAPVSPSNDIVCKDCEFRLKRNRIDFKNAYCNVYTPEISRGKPYEILFKNEKCEYYIREEKDAE